MESPKFEIMESNVFQTKRLLEKMEEKMRNQLKGSEGIYKNEDYEDVRSKKRKKNKELQRFKNEKELERELEEFREKLKGIEENEEFYEGKTNGKSFSEERKRVFGEREGVSEEKTTVRGFRLENSTENKRIKDVYKSGYLGRSNENAKKSYVEKDFSTLSNVKQKKISETIEGNTGFNELKYGLEIRILREDLQRLKSSKIHLEKEIILLKSHLRPNKDSLKK